MQSLQISPTQHLDKALIVLLRGRLGRHLSRIGSFVWGRPFSLGDGGVGLLGARLGLGKDSMIQDGWKQESLRILGHKLMLSIEELMGLFRKFL